MRRQAGHPSSNAPPCLQPSSGSAQGKQAAGALRAMHIPRHETRRHVLANVQREVAWSHDICSEELLYPPQDQDENLSSKATITLDSATLLSTQFSTITAHAAPLLHLPAPEQRPDLMLSGTRCADDERSGSANVVDFSARRGLSRSDGRVLGC